MKWQPSEFWKATPREFWAAIGRNEQIKQQQQSPQTRQPRHQK